MQKKCLIGTWFTFESNVGFEIPEGDGLKEYLFGPFVTPASHLLQFNSKDE
jgi:hypothetical protein